MSDCPCSSYAVEFQHPYHVTIRLSTAAERKSVGRHFDGGKNMRARKWIVVEVEDPSVLAFTFGMPNDGKTKAEAVFWAERFASKSGLGYIPPKGWEKIKGDLPERDDDK